MSEVRTDGVIDSLVTGLRSDLDRVSEYDIRPLPELEGRLNHNGKYFRVDVDLPAGLYLDDSAFETSRRPQSFEFQPQHGSRVGREDSHNNVFFGKLWAKMANGSEEHIQVSAKPLPKERTERLKGELAAFQYLGSLALPTFRPAGLFVTENDNNYLMTYFDGPVATMDTINWGEVPRHELWYELEPAIDTLTMLQRKALFHGDLYFRNIAFNERGETVVVDPEHMVSAKDAFDTLEGVGLDQLDDQQEVALRSIVRLMQKDFADVETSIEQSVLRRLPKRERPRTSEERYRAYKEYLYEPYRSNLLKTQDTTGQTLLRAYSVMLMAKKTMGQREIL
jgi:hypothetical protein